MTATGAQVAAKERALAAKPTPVHVPKPGKRTERACAAARAVLRGEGAPTLAGVVVEPTPGA